MPENAPENPEVPDSPLNPEFPENAPEKPEYPDVPERPEYPL